MRKRRKKRKTRFVETLRVQAQKVAKPSKNLFPVFLGIALIAFAGKGSQSFLCRSPYFRVINMEILGDRQQSGEEARFFAGLGEDLNIFRLNISEIAERIQKEHPEFLSVEVERHVPGRLVVRVKERKSVAQIRLRRYFLVDAGGFILPQVRNFADPDLPIIVGLDPEKTNIKAGEQSELKGVLKALTLLKEIESSPISREYEVKVIDITDYRNLSFLTAEGIEVKIGEGKFKKRLELLATVLSQLKASQSSPKYIDLRFGDPVIGTR